MSGRTKHIADEGGKLTLCGQRTEGMDRNDITSRRASTCYYCAEEWERRNTAEDRPQRVAHIYGEEAEKARRADLEKIKSALIASGCDEGAVALVRIDMHGVAIVRADLLLQLINCPF